MSSYQIGLPEGSVMDRCKKRIRKVVFIKRHLLREFLAEFLGTFILVVIGDGCVAQSVLSGGSHGQFISVNFGWCWAVSLGVYVSGGMSGGHINPAISLLMAVLGRIDWKKLLVYMVAQYLGAFVGAAAVYATYIDAINSFDGGIRAVVGQNATAGIFATYPKDYVSTAEGFWDQFFGTLLLAMSVLAITDSRNMDVSLGVAPLALGGTVLAIGLSYGYNCGFAINPARDFAPRFFTFVVGYGSEVFSARNYYFWIPIVAPHIGGLVGGLLYVLFIGLHLEIDEEMEKEQNIYFMPERNWTARPSIFLKTAEAGRDLDGNDLPIQNLMTRTPRVSIKLPGDVKDTVF